MAASHIVDYWEKGFDREPPLAAQSLVAEREELLWATCIKSSFSVLPGILFGLVALALAAFFAVIAPWGESLPKYCGLDASYSCRKLYYVIWPGIFAWIALSAGGFWAAKNSASTPGLLTYAVSTKRAFILDERKPEEVRSVDLDSHKARLEKFGIVAFGPPRTITFGFGGLDAGAASKAVYWATEGRKKQMTLLEGI